MTAFQVTKILLVILFDLFGVLLHVYVVEKNLMQRRYPMKDIIKKVAQKLYRAKQVRAVEVAAQVLVESDLLDEFFFQVVKDLTHTSDPNCASIGRFKLVRVEKLATLNVETGQLK